MFLHPSQREIVERSYAGPARVAGSAGTGKTVAALHRAVRLARDTPSARILLTSFSQPLADALTAKVSVLAPDTGTIVPRITTASFQGIADPACGAKRRACGQARPAEECVQRTAARRHPICFNGLDGGVFTAAIDLRECPLRTGIL